MYDQCIVIQKKTEMLWPKYCITKVNKVLYNKSKQRYMTKVCITNVSKDVLPMYCNTKENKDVMTKVLHYKSKQSIV